MDEEAKGSSAIRPSIERVAQDMVSLSTSIQEEYIKYADITKNFESALSVITKDISQGVQVAVAEADSCIVACMKAEEDVHKLADISRRLELLGPMVSTLEKEARQLISAERESRLPEATWRSSIRHALQLGPMAAFPSPTPEYEGSAPQ